MRFLLLFLLLQWSLVTWVHGDEQPLMVEVADPFIEMHTGPGRGYPIFHVVARGEQVEILTRKTDWIKVQESSGKQGWVHRRQMTETLQPSGEKLEIKDATQDDFTSRSWEMGGSIGDFEGADVITLYGAYHFTDNLSTEGYFSQVLGSFSSSSLIGINVVHQPFPEWRISPFFSLGTGIIDTRPKTTLVQTKDRTDKYANVGIGGRMYLSRRFILRFEYRSYVIFSSRDDNEEIDEWKTGLSFFF